MTAPATIPLVPLGPGAPPRPAADGDPLEARAPRYTSYPTADRMRESFRAGDYAHHLARRDPRSTGWLSLYAHVPFCHELCWYCACNKTVTNRRSKGARYLDALEAELDLVAKRLGGQRVAGSLHLGGGTPTWLDDDELARLVAAFEARFDFHARAERAIEIDPRSVDAARVARLAELGFDRVSIGVQDLDPDVQRAINRVQPLELTRTVIETARAAGVSSINVDLVHGLPHQSAARFAPTLERMVELRPERIALFNYAHLPARFAGQRLIDERALPSLAERLAIVALARERLEAAGYVAIGLDHFAVPEDELAVAWRSGRLHRDFQGYSTRPDRDLLAFGPSAISDLGGAMVQNERGFGAWASAIEAGRLPVARGLVRTRDDLLRGLIIKSLMCNGRVDIPEIETGWLVDFPDYFAEELVRLGRFAAQGLVRIDGDSIDVTPAGRVRALRTVAAVFDRRSREADSGATFSRAC